MPFSFSLCNEVLRELDFSEQCKTAAKLGYTGLEVAPFTLSDSPHRIESAERKRLRRIAEDSGLKIVGLHWLLVKPEGLSINSRDRAQRQRTVRVIQGLIELCADLGGSVLVHGSPKQRQVGEDDDPKEAWKRAVETFQSVAPTAEAAGVRYCFEPLSKTETNFINSVEEAARLVQEIGSPAVCTMIDTRAARLSESQPPSELVKQWLPTGLIGHIHFNDQNSRAPGQGQDRFLPVLESLHQSGYEGAISIEPFQYHPSGEMAAAFAIGYLEGILEGLDALRN